MGKVITSFDDRSLLFWFNDDKESVLFKFPDVQSESEPFLAGLGSRETDSADSRIRQTRDLEDFASMTLYVDPLLSANDHVVSRTLSLQDDHEESISANIFHEFDGNLSNSRQHVQNVNQAADHAGVPYFNKAVLFDIGHGPSVFREGDLDDHFNPFLIEFASPALNGATPQGHLQRDATLELTITVNYPDGRSKQLKSTLAFDVREMLDFYDVFDVVYRDQNGEDLRLNPDVTSFPEFTQSNESGVNNEGVGGFNEADYVLLVHGWNLNEPWKEGFGETAFKRLYWQGFSGHFGLFNWPTYFDPNLPWIVEWYNGIDSTYNPSEFVAFRSAAALRNVLESLKSAHDNIGMIAHSMGNIVAGEALRLWAEDHPNEPLVSSYIATQAAVASGAYGSDESSVYSISDYYRYFAHGSQMSGDYIFADSATAASQWINIYNPLDNALSKWELNNFFKPILLWQSSVWPFDYGYQTMHQLGGDVIADWTRYPDGGGAVALSLGDPTDWGANAYEIMAFFGRAHSKALGQSDMGGSSRFRSVDLGALGYSPNMPSGAERPNHSYQFHYDIHTTWPYWSEIRVSSGFASTYLG